MSESRRWKMSIIGEGEADPRTLTRHPDNPKVHTAEQDAVVTASLDRVGWLRRILVNQRTGHVLDGDQRIVLAIRYGEPTVPYYVCDIPAEEEGMVLMTLDASAQLAQVHGERWSRLVREAPAKESALLALWARLAQQAESPGVGDTSPVPGGSAGVEAEREIEDRGARLQQEWETALGQLWQLGAHRVWCGDSTAAAGWGLLKEEVGVVQGCLTSPPYAEQRLKAYGGILAAGYVAWFRQVAAAVWEALASDGSFFLNLKEHSEDIRRPVYVHALIVALVEELGWEYLDEFCWERPGIPGDAVARGKFKNMWEPVFWLAKQVRPVFHPERARHYSEKALQGPSMPGGLALRQGSGEDFLGEPGRRGPGLAYPGNRLPTFGSAEALGQPAAFPLGLPRFFVEVYSEPGGWWIDPFGGSGTVLMACEELGRRAWLMERDPRYVAITLERYAAGTGQAPRLVA